MTNRRGFALLASAWLMVAIAAVAFEVSWLARTRRLATANLLEEEQARAAAEAGLEHARARLAQSLGAAPADPLADPWRLASGRPDTVPMTGASYDFSVRDDAAALDVNRASEDQLRALVAACGADDAVARQVAQHIGDWRDPDTHRRASGAERADYLVAGARALPRDGDVQRIEELDEMLDLPDGPWQCARAHLEVGGTGLVNPNTAPREVLMALPGMTERAAEALLAARRNGAPLRNFQEFLDRIPPALREGAQRHSDQLMPLLSWQTNAVRVASSGWLDGSPVRVRAEALMVRGGRSVFVQWRGFR